MNSPRRVALFVTCIVDRMYPQIGMATATVLQRLGVSVAVPAGLTCCGQLAFNAGYRREAYSVAGRTLELLHGYDAVVLPSGSCAAMIRHMYAELFAQTAHAALAAELAARTYEFTEYLVDVLGVQDVGAHYPARATYHTACHGLHYLGLAQQAYTLLAHVQGLELVPLSGSEQCCGFGGLFAVKQAPISGAILDAKLANIARTDAELVITGDASCMTQIAGGLWRNNARARAIHIAEVLQSR